MLDHGGVGFGHVPNIKSSGQHRLLITSYRFLSYLRGLKTKDKDKIYFFNVKLHRGWSPSPPSQRLLIKVFVQY